MLRVNSILILLLRECSYKLLVDDLRVKIIIALGCYRNPQDRLVIGELNLSRTSVHFL